MVETIALVGAVVGVLTGITGLIVRLNGGMRRLMAMVDDWNGAPARPGVAARPGVMERLSDVEAHVADVRHHVQPNSGKSAHDAVMRELAAIREKLDSSEEVTP